LDDTYQVYVNRVVRMTLPEAYQSQVQYIQLSPKFQQQPDGTIQPAPFPGYTVISPPWLDDEKNQAFYTHLQTYQQQMLEQLDPGLIVPVPPQSFHFTLADLIWAGAYDHAARDPSFEPQLHDRVAQSFEKCQALVQAEQPISWQVIGLFLRTRAIGVCLVPKNQESYERVMQLRQTLYQNPNLIALGVEQQYDFTAHITLGYFGEAITRAGRDRLSSALIKLSNQWLETDSPQEIWVHRAELRKFDDMTRYYREPDWPILQF
jgi:hypothetical protein